MKLMLRGFTERSPQDCGAFIRHLGNEVWDFSGMDENMRKERSIYLCGLSEIRSRTGRAVD